MPQSLACTIVHIVFSTKDRAPLLKTPIRPALYAYLAGVARNVGCECYRVGGAADHIHVIIRLSRTITLANLLEELKTSSSKWMKTELPHTNGFSWQRGYAAFSVGPRELNPLLDYVDGQEEHHRIHTFQEEYRTLLQQYAITYDERYMWD